MIAMRNPMKSALSCVLFSVAGLAAMGSAQAATYVDETRCFPIAPSTPTGLTVSRTVDGRGGTYSVIAWRQVCPTDPEVSVLLLKFDMVSGSPQVVARDVLVEQSGSYFAPVALTKNVNGPDFAQTGPITGVGVLVNLGAAGFDANAKLTIHFNDSAFGGRASMTLPPAPGSNPSANVTVFAPNMGDMWWSSAENGTGMSIVHHGTNQLFIIWYTYTDAGDPLWIVFPGGTWSDNRTFAGDLFTTKGTGFTRPWNQAALTATRVGNGSLRFNGHDSVTFTYTVNGVNGSRTYVRQRF